MRKINEDFYKYAFLLYAIFELEKLSGILKMVIDN